MALVILMLNYKLKVFVCQGFDTVIKGIPRRLPPLRGLGGCFYNSNPPKKLQLNCCKGIGDYGTFSSFIKCLKGLEPVELTSCGIIVDGILSKLTENCVSLNSPLVYDGGSREGLLQFISQTQCNLEKLNLRLPLDLDDNHLTAMAENLGIIESNARK